MKYVPRQVHQQQQPLVCEAFGGLCPWQRIHRSGRGYISNISREWPAGISQRLSLLKVDAFDMFAYPEKLYVVEDLIIKRKIIAWDDIDAILFLYLPVLLSETLAFCEKIFLREFPAPVGLCSFLEVSVDSHTREAKHGAEFGVSNFQWRGKISCLRLNHLGVERSIQCQLEINSMKGID